VGPPGSPAGEDDAGGDARALRVNRSLAIPLSELTFRFGPSGGPGGQHANKASTRVELRFDVEHSASLRPGQRARLLERFGRHVRVVADGNRSQSRNREEAVERLRQRLADALVTKRPRTPTRPSRGAVERRLDEKRRRSQQKQARRPDSED
jgi:ribosome-associated protein